MKKIDVPEAGYTPENLKTLRQRYGLTQAQVAQITETATGYTVRRWEASPDAKNRSDMPLVKWLKFLKYIENIS